MLPLVAGLPTDEELARIVVIGVTGSGKTTLGRRLARARGVPFVELDALHWGPGWTPASDEAFGRSVDRALAGERWVADGNYSQVRSHVWGRASLVVWLRYPWWRSFARLLRRTFGRIATREELYGGNRETLRAALFDRESILWWSIAMHPPVPAPLRACPGRRVVAPAAAGVSATRTRPRRSRGQSKRAPHRRSVK